MFPVKLPDRYAYTGDEFAGAQGIVYKCLDRHLNRFVAIKVMKDLQNSEQLVQELASLRDIKSTHIAQIYDCITLPDRTMIALVQEYVPGVDLFAYATQAHQDLDYLTLLYQLASGIADVHAHDRVHRDIKPHNMKLDQERIVKLLDFGFACRAEPDAKTWHRRGTLAFRAPELYESPPARFTTAVDTYAFGVTAWMLAAKGTLPPALLQTPPQATAKAPSFSTLGIGLPEEIVELLDLTLNIRPDSRPAMQDVRDAVARRILYGRHRAIISGGADRHQLSMPGQAVNIKAHSASVRIQYDGLRFKVEAVAGDVYINNSKAFAHQVLPGSCVITIGGPALGYGRRFLSFDVSHPEVVL
jgi:serine/threonine protein kinase